MIPVSFDPRWDRLPHLFAGELPEAEADALRQWIDAAPERREAVERLREIWQLTAAAPRVWDAEAGLAAVRRRVDEEGDGVIVRGDRPASPVLAVLPPRRRGWWPAVAGVAAALLVIAGGVAFRLGVFGQRSPAAFAEFTTRPGQRLTLRLSDGTLVMLAPATTLRQPAAYGRSNRMLYLDGEAAFVVVHDAARPFAVSTARAVARDLGTRFVVRAYAADSVTDVAVAEGMVAVRRTDRHAPASGADSVILVRGQRVRLTPGGGLQTVGGIALDTYFGWTEGRLAFRDTPLGEAARELARWHGVEIRLADSATAARRLTATFGDEPIADVIHRIATSLDLDVRQVDRAFTLRVR